MKTTMMVMIQGIDKASEMYLSGGYDEAYKATIPLKELALKLLEKEKEQIVEAYWGGLNGSINDYSDSKKVGNEIIGIKYSDGAEQYYNQTYLEESKQ